jgi:GNAT superfamily N-acetyltransferase
MTSIICRPAVPEDAPTIVDFQLLMARETEDVTLDPETCSLGVAAVFEKPSLGCYYVAEKNGRVIASTMITYEWSDWRNGTVWWIQSVYVPPAERRQGVFTALYHYLRQQAESDPHIRGIRLYVDLRNTRAQQVYACLGMNGDHYSVFEWMKS